MTKLVLCVAAILLVGYSCEGKVASRFGQFNVYQLYTRDNARNPESLLVTTAGANAQARNFRSQVVLLIHDHDGDRTSSQFISTVKDALLTSEDVTVVVVNWGIVANTGYANAVAAVPFIAEGTIDFLKIYIAANRIAVARLHIVGLGLGAHIGGIAAREIKSWRSEIARITALDPTGRQVGSGFTRVSRNDAAYVEAIHTDTVDSDDAVAIGIRDALGHIDFYSNGGTAQSGCDNDHDCNHKRSWELFAASLTHQNLEGNQCEPEAEPTAENCRGFLVALGNNANDKYGQGSFYLETGQTYPYDVRAEETEAGSVDSDSENQQIF